jgi:protein gp37
MSGDTKIEWATKVWNPVTGCTKVSEGCRHCYAERVAKRFWGERSFNDVRCHDNHLDAPMHWKTPQRVFVNSMSDLFHPDVPDGFIFGAFMRMAKCSQHTFIILTKRPERMHEWIIDRWMTDYIQKEVHPELVLDNVWVGVSVENQKAADERIPVLLKTPAAIRFVSVEPMLGMVDLEAYIGDLFDDSECGKEMPAIDWVICGGESGPNARPVYPEWVRDLRDQCIRSRTPFFFKHWGEYECIKSGDSICPVRVGKKRAGRLIDGKEWNEYPEAAK